MLRTGMGRVRCCRKLCGPDRLEMGQRLVRRSKEGHE